MWEKGKLPQCAGFILLGEKAGYARRSEKLTPTLLGVGMFTASPMMYNATPTTSARMWLDRKNVRDFPASRSVTVERVVNNIRNEKIITATISPSQVYLRTGSDMSPCQP